LSQTYQPLEILVVDDGSTDQTVKIARSFRDARLQVVANARNRGLVGNWNECVRLAKGEYIKFLFQDDRLHSRCVEEMMRLFSQHESLGLVFSLREIILEDDLDADYAREWMTRYGTLHTHFEDMREINDGRALFAQCVLKGFASSCIGEPTTVLIKKECFERLGLFNARMHQICDVEMWLRIMYFYDIGFIDEKLSTVRVHVSSATSSNHKNQKHVFDPIWLLEGLLSHDEIRRNHPEIGRMRDEQLARNSLLRPSAGWRSLRNADGLRQAREDVALIPRRAHFLMTYLGLKLRHLLGRAGFREQP
jgi:glycosyltransferase involved in cell wall biosynthesis